MISKCLECEKPLSLTAKYYCNSICQSVHLTKERIASWYAGTWDGNTPRGALSTTIKAHVLALANGECPSCGWDKKNPATGRVPLEVNHVDGDWQNNRPGNLEVLCPNCHSLTPNYKALNKGNGRTWRKQYDQFKALTPEEIEVRRISQREAAGHSPELTSTVCECGNIKERSAAQCQTCWRVAEAERVSQSYPPMEEILVGVRQMGWLVYAKTLGKSDNGLRKHLSRNGVDPKSVRKLTKVEREALLPL